MGNDRNTNTEKFERLKKLVDDAYWELSTLHSVLWAADVLLEHNPDKTISQMELETRINDLIRTSIGQIEALSTKLDPEEGVCNEQ